MVKTVKILVVIALVAGAAYFLYNFFMSDEKKVISQLDKLAQLVSKEGEEPALMMAQRIRGVADLFAETCQFSSDARHVSRTFRPDEITSHTASARANFLNLSLKFYDINVDFPEEGLARASLTAILTGLGKSDELFDETHELEVEFVKSEKGWLIQRIRAVEVLQK